MSVPAQTQILNEIGARLALPTIAGGYSADMAKVERARLTPFKGHDLPATNYWPESDVKVSAGGGYENRELKVMIEVHDKTRDEPFTDVSLQLASDVCIAMYRATGAATVADNPSPSLGGLVTGISIDSILPEIGEGQSPFCGALVEITVSYKLKIDDPFTLIP